jgi:hypothetical protein
MDFDLSEDQRLLQDSLGKLLKDKYGFEQRKAIIKSGAGWSRESGPPMRSSACSACPSPRRMAASATAPSRR